MQTHKLRDFGIALSLANLCFFPVWAELLPGAYGHYFLKSPPGASIYLAAILDLCALAGLFWLLMAAVRRSRRPGAFFLARGVFLLVLAAALNNIRGQCRPFLSSQPAFSVTALPVPLQIALAVAGIAVLWRWFRHVIHATVVLVMILLPFVLVTCGQAAWAATRVHYRLPFAEFADKPVAPPLPVHTSSAPRILWWLFDGLDPGLAFTDRSPTLHLPHLDRFRSQALYATHAYSPAHNTLRSLPALISGRPVAFARPIRANELIVQYSDTGTAERWSTQPNIFSRSRALGFNAAIVGFYHPYCRLFGDQLTQCSSETDWWRSMGLSDPHMTVPMAMVQLMATVVGDLQRGTPLLWQLEWANQTTEAWQRELWDQKHRREHIANYQHILAGAKRTATDPSLGLVFVHWPVPHQPLIYDRVRQDFAWQGKSTYLDNVALVDRTVGEMRRTMEEAGTWQTTAILITSDHGFDHGARTHQRVPFLLKLAGQTDTLVYEGNFNTVLTQSLLLAMLRGELPDAHRVSAWLDAHRLPGSAAYQGESCD